MDEPHVIPWGSGEVARALGVATATVQQWRFRGIFPDPDIRQGARNFWWPQTVELWARVTGRAPVRAESVRRATDHPDRKTVEAAMEEAGEDPARADVTACLAAAIDLEPDRPDRWVSIATKAWITRQAQGPREPRVRAWVKDR